jgi:hypothetical protein
VQPRYTRILGRIGDWSGGLIREYVQKSSSVEEEWSNYGVQIRPTLPSILATYVLFSYALRHFVGYFSVYYGILCCYFLMTTQRHTRTGRPPVVLYRDLGAVCEPQHVEVAELANRRHARVRHIRAAAQLNCVGGGGVLKECHALQPGF